SPKRFCKPSNMPTSSFRVGNHPSPGAPAARFARGAPPSPSRGRGLIQAQTPQGAHLRCLGAIPGAISGTGRASTDPDGGGCSSAPCPSQTVKWYLTGIKPPITLNIGTACQDRASIAQRICLPILAAELCDDRFVRPQGPKGAVSDRQ